MKIVFDTNVLLDVLLQRPGFEASLQLVAALSKRKIVGIVTANSITDFYYLAEKRLGIRTARYAVFLVLYMFLVFPLDGKLV